MCLTFQLVCYFQLDIDFVLTLCFKCYLITRKKLNEAHLPMYDIAVEGLDV